MSDEQVAQLVGRLQFLKQIEDLGAYRDVQCRNRLVQHDQLGPGGKGAGDSDALTLTTAELMGIPLGMEGV